MEPESVSPGGGQDAGPRAAAGADSKQLPSLLESVLIGGSMRDPPRTLPRTADGVNRSQALGEVSYQLPLYAHAPQTHMVSRSWGAATVPPHSAYPHGGLTAPSTDTGCSAPPAVGNPRPRQRSPSVTLRFCPASVGAPCSWTHWTLTPALTRTGPIQARDQGWKPLESLSLRATQR